MNPTGTKIVPPPFNFSIPPPPITPRNPTFNSDLSSAPYHSVNFDANAFLKREPSTWGLTFHVTSKDLPVENFIFRVESIASGVFHLNLNNLILEFSEFLKDEAQFWY